MPCAVRHSHPCVRFLQANFAAFNTCSSKSAAMSGSASILVRPATPPVVLPTIVDDTPPRIQDAGIFLMDTSAGYTLTMPPCDAADIGTEFTIVVSVTGGAVDLTLSPGNFAIGGLTTKVGAGAVGFLLATGAETTLELPDNTVVGSTITATMVSSTQWKISGIVESAGRAITLT